MKYGYARVSTTDQKLANQIELLKLAGAEKIFQEKFTGTTTARPEFQKLLQALKIDQRLHLQLRQLGVMVCRFC